MDKPGKPAMERRILITGADGFVGRHALATLVQRMRDGDVLHGTTRTGDGAGAQPILWHTMDLVEASSVEAVLRSVEPTHILHLAGFASVGSAHATPEMAWQINTLGSLNLAVSVKRRAPHATLLFASSSEVYGRAFLDDAPVSEATIPQPLGAYATSKYAAELAFTTTLPATARLIVLRPFNHIGAGQREDFVAASFAAQIARAELGHTPPVIETGNLSAERDFLDVHDVVRCYADLIDAADGLPLRAVYNIGSGTTRPVSSLLEELVGQARRPLQTRLDPARQRPAEIRRACGDVSAIEAAIGWKPLIGFSDTIAAILQDARNRAAGPE